MARSIVVLYLALMLWPIASFAQSEPVITEVSPEPLITEIEQPAVTANTAAPEAPAGDLPGQLAKGHALYLSGDFNGALNTYVAAEAIAPSEPKVYLFVGYAQAKLGKYDDSVVALRTVTTMLAGKDVSLHAKALFVTAWVEEMRGDREAIRNAWTSYEGYAQVHTDAVTFATTAKARLAALDRMQKLDEQYRAVRERIASGNK